MYYLEYDLLAKVIQQQPNRQETERYICNNSSYLLVMYVFREIANLKQKLKQLEMTKKDLHSKVNMIFNF